MQDRAGLGHVVFGNIVQTKDPLEPDAIESVEDDLSDTGGQLVVAEGCAQFAVHRAEGLNEFGVVRHRRDEDCAGTVQLVGPFLGVLKAHGEQRTRHATRLLWLSIDRGDAVVAPLGHDSFDECFDQRVFARKVMEEPALACPGLSRDGVERETRDAESKGDFLARVEQGVIGEVGGFGRPMDHGEVYQLKHEQSNRLDGRYSMSGIEAWFQYRREILQGNLLATVGGIKGDQNTLGRA